jgi:hypothetical protein
LWWWWWWRRFLAPHYAGKRNLRLFSRILTVRFTKAIWVRTSKLDIATSKCGTQPEYGRILGAMYQEQLGDQKPESTHWKRLKRIRATHPFASLVLWFSASLLLFIFEDES